MFKGQKGITLIALVITIIVLLILAGVSIAMLSGNDSTPAKANEAVIKDAVSAGKDAVNLAGTSALAEYYDKTYVANSTSSSTATSAKAAVYNAGVAATSNNVTIEAATADESIKVKYDDNNYSIGTVNENGGITWVDTFAQ